MTHMTYRPPAPSRFRVSPQRWGPAEWVSSNCARWTGSWRHPNLRPVRSGPICRDLRRFRRKAPARCFGENMVKTMVKTWWKPWDLWMWNFRMFFKNLWLKNGMFQKKTWLEYWMVTWAMSSEMPPLPCLRQIKTTSILRSRFFVMDPFTQGLKILVDPAIKGRLICHWWQASTTYHGQSYHIYGPIGR